MKNYRNLKRYQIDEWEQDIRWLGKRLDFLWEVRNYKPSLYLQLGLQHEKEDLYSLSDSRIHKIAIERHYSVDVEKYNKIYQNVSISEQYEKFKYLKRLMNIDFNEFLLKKNCNLYEYFNIKNANGYFKDLEQYCE